MTDKVATLSRNGRELNFIEYWESLGFFDTLQVIIPPKFFILFEIARLIYTGDASDAFNAIEEISKQEIVYKPNRDESIQVNRVERISPISDKMEIDTFRKIHELKKALPRELALDDDMFNVKLLTKSLLVQKHYESEADSFKPISTSRNDAGKDANRFEQKFYILLDRSRSMDMKMRSFYSKCIVAEFLRRKINTKTKLYYRPFDSQPGRLFKVSKREDFPILMEKVLLTTTGGTSTNIQNAVTQAVKDINYDKEKIKSEILIVTDGVSKIDKFTLKKTLGDIKLHVLKIGDDCAVPDYFEMENEFKASNIDPSSVNLKRARDKLGEIKKGAMNNAPTGEVRVYRKLLDLSENMVRDLREVATQFIEVGDLKADGLFVLTDDTIQEIRSLAQKFSSIHIADLEVNAKKSMYKQVYFLTQYIQMLIDNGNESDAILKDAHDTLMSVRQKMLKDPELLFTIIEVEEFDKDKKMMKLAKKEARKLLQQMKLNNKNISIEDMKRAQLLFTMDMSGEGNMGRFIQLLLIKLFQFLKRIAAAPFTKS